MDASLLENIGQWVTSLGAFLLTAGGFVLSIYAIFQAQSAKRMVSRIVGRTNDQEDANNLRDVIALVNTARDVALRRQHAANVRQAGIKEEDDIQELRRAHDSLKAGMPISMENVLQQNLAPSIGDLLNGIDGICNGNKDKWKDTLASLQNIVPHLVAEERSIRNRLLNA